MEAVSRPRSRHHWPSSQEARDTITALMGWDTYLNGELDMAESITNTTETPADDTGLVHRRWVEVMRTVLGLGKNQRNPQQGFNFRGIDAVMNAVGPALREHGVMILPNVTDITTERYETAKGAVMQGVIVHVEYTVMAEDGSAFTGSAYGQAADSGDKAVSKAMSVAYRTFLLQALTLPTDEPDPDMEVHQRGGTETWGGTPPTPAAPPGPPLTAETRGAIEALFGDLMLSEAQRASGLRRYTGRAVSSLDALSEDEGQRVLLALERKMQSQQAAPTAEVAEALVSRALGGTPVEDQ